MNKEIKTTQKNGYNLELIFTEGESIVFSLIDLFFNKDVKMQLSSILLILEGEGYTLDQNSEDTLHDALFEALEA